MGTRTMKTETRVLCEHSSNGRQLLDILEKGESIFLTMVLKQYITFSLNHPRASPSRSTSYAIPSSHTLNLLLFFVLKCAFISVQDLRLFFKTNKPQQNTTTRTITKNTHKTHLVYTTHIHTTNTQQPHTSQSPNP